MIEFDVFLPGVMTFAPSAPEPVAIRLLREVAQKLCTDTMIWRENDQIIISGGATPDAVTNIPDAEIIEIESARWIGEDGARAQLEPQTIKWLDRNEPNWSYDRAPTGGVPRFISQIIPDTVIVVPNAEGVVDVRLVLMPSHDCAGLPNVLRRYQPLLERGAAGRLLTLPDAEYANPALGAALWSEFLDGVVDATRDVRRTQLGGRTRTRGAYF